MRTSFVVSRKINSAVILLYFKGSADTTRFTVENWQLSGKSNFEPVSEPAHYCRPFASAQFVKWCKCDNTIIIFSIMWSNNFDIDFINCDLYGTKIEDVSATIAWIVRNVTGMILYIYTITIQKGA